MWHVSSVRVPTILALSSLPCACTVLISRPCVQLRIPNQSAEPGCDKGAWVQASGALRFKLCQDLRPFTNLSVSFILRNPATPQAPPRVSVNIIQGTNRFVDLPINGSVFGAGGAPGIGNVSVSESTRVVSQPNEITFEFSANIALLRGTDVTVTDLLGYKHGVSCTDQSQVYALEQMSVSFSRGSIGNTQSSIAHSGTIQRVEGRCVQSKTSMTVKLPRDYIQYETVRMYILYLNEDVAQPGSVPSISLSGGSWMFENRFRVGRV